MSTLDCYATRLVGGTPTRARRATHNAICLVVAGEGRSTVGEQTFEWTRHDVFTVPHWTWATHESRSPRGRPVRGDRPGRLRAARPPPGGAAVDRSEGIGAAIRRREDPRLLTGRGRFVDDLALPGALHCAFVRSPHAHARLAGIDVAPAARMPGVVAVLTGADTAADGVGPMQSLWRIRSRDGRPMAEPPRWALARERVRHVGEPVALVVAESAAAAHDAAGAVAADYAPLPAVTDSRDGLAPGAPALHDVAPGNVASGGDAATRPRSGRGSRARPTWSGSTWSTTGSAGSRWSPARSWPPGTRPPSG